MKSKVSKNNWNSKKIGFCIIYGKPLCLAVNCGDFNCLHIAHKCEKYSFFIGIFLVCSINQKIFNKIQILFAITMLSSEFTVMTQCSRLHSGDIVIMSAVLCLPIVELPTNKSYVLIRPSKFNIFKQYFSLLFLSAMMANQKMLTESKKKNNETKWI